MPSPRDPPFSAGNIIAVVAGLPSCGGGLRADEPVLSSAPCRTKTSPDETYRSSEMFRLSLIMVGCIISTVASAQEWKPVLEKWRACADAAAVRYAKSTESAPVVARLAILSCVTERKAALEAVKQVESATFTEDYIDTLERRYIDILAVRVMEMRLR